MPPQRILYVSDFRFPWCTAVHIARTMERLGHQVWRIQENTTTPADIERQATLYDTTQVWYQRTWGFGAANGELTDRWRKMEADGRITVSYHLDLYVGLDREATVAGDPFWTTQFVFTADGDPLTAAWMADHGINHHWMAPAVVADETMMGDVDTGRFPWDVVFVGSEQYHGEWDHRRDLLTVLQSHYGERFHRYGNGAEVVRGFDLNTLYRTVPVAVGDSLCMTWPDGTRHRNYFSDRYFETVGRGGFLVAPNVPGLDWFLIDGVHYAGYEFGDWDGMRAQVDRALADPDWRAVVARAGHDHVAAHHTYDVRITQALRIIDKGHA